MQEIILVLGAYMAIMGMIYFYKFFTTKRDDLKAHYKKKLIRGGLAGVLLLLMLIAYSLLRSNMYGVGMGGSVPIPQIPTSAMTIARYPDYYYNNNNGNVTDTREYNKKTFSASMKSRAVEEVAKKVETLIKSSGGRIDSSNISDKYATFSFVVPKSNFDAFETQMRTFVSKKLYSQTVTSQNLLNEKQNIEKSQSNTAESIASTKKQRDQVEADYTARINTIKSQIATVKAQIVDVDSDIARTEKAINNTTDQNTKNSLAQELNNLSNTRRTYNQYIANYNSDIEIATSNFKSQMTMYGSSLDSQNQVLAQLGVQETTFLDKVETVQGSVSINFITMWELLNIYSPVNLWVVIGIIVLIGRLYLLKKEEDGLKN